MLPGPVVPWSLGYRARLFDWDLCVLAIGSSGAIFTLPKVRNYLGEIYTVDATALMLLVTVLLGLLVIWMRKIDHQKISGMRGILALALGGTALAIPWYIVMKA